MPANAWRCSLIAALVIVSSGLCLGGTTSSVIAITDQTEFLVVFDESHGQYFNVSLMDSALSALNDSNYDVNVELRVLNDSGFSQSNLQGADLVIIGNPGRHVISDEVFNLTEGYSLQEYYHTGGNLLMMSNPMSSHENISGNPGAFNSMLTLAGFTTSRFIGDVADNAADIRDDYDTHFYGVNESYRYMSGDLLLDEVIFEEPYAVNHVLAYTGAVEGSDMDVSAYSNYTAYLLDEEGEESKIQERPAWMITGDDLRPAGSNKTSGRIVFTGSTIMFSDLEADTGEKFISSFDNLNVFRNMVFWLLGITPLEDVGDPIETDMTVFIAIISLAASAPIVCFVVYLVKRRPEVHRQTVGVIHTGKTTTRKKTLRKRKKRT